MVTFEKTLFYIHTVYYVGISTTRRTRPDSGGGRGQAAMGDNQAATGYDLAATERELNGREFDKQHLLF